MDPAHSKLPLPSLHSSSPLLQKSQPGHSLGSCLDRPNASQNQDLISVVQPDEAYSSAQQVKLFGREFFKKNKNLLSPLEVQMYRRLNRIEGCPRTERLRVEQGLQGNQKMAKGLKQLIRFNVTHQTAEEVVNQKIIQDQILAKENESQAKME